MWNGKIWFGDVLCRFLWIWEDGEDFVEFCSTIRHFVDISPVSLLNLGHDCLHGEIQPFVEGYRSWGFSCGEHNEISAILIIIMMMLLMLIIIMIVTMITIIMITIIMIIVIMITISILVHGGEHVFPVLVTKGRQTETEPVIINKVKRRLSWRLF